jgi:ATP-dependent helicase Lhr and Lhr-like helicase
MGTHKGITKIERWFASIGWSAAEFQKEAWQSYIDGNNTMIVAPTGSGKTYSALLGALAEALCENNHTSPQSKPLCILWVTPIRALAKEIAISCQRAVDGLGMDWEVAVRTGDTSLTEKARQIKNNPQILITTPESIHVLLCNKNYPDFFSSLKLIVADEWHELVGSKRGVQMELALSRLKTLSPNLRIWGISATIGNLEQAAEVLFGYGNKRRSRVIKANIDKRIEVVTLLPDEVERFPWAGHIGLRMVHQILKIVKKAKSCLIFTNTRAQCEIWYQKILEEAPDLAGLMAMHHGSISRELRDWVEDSLYDGKIKLVVCTSSLDLGVDFRPVDTVIQIGSPKGVSRFLQRAGRSGHAPGQLSRIYFAPTNALEILEGTALRQSVQKYLLEERIPYVRSFDVLLQYLMTLAVSRGFKAEEVYREIQTTFSYQSVSMEEWQSLMAYLRNGTSSLQAYQEYRKIGVINGVYMVQNRGIALRHRLSIGTIVSDAMMQVCYMNGKRLGVVEEWFLTQLKPGDAFWFAGRALQLKHIKELTAYVQNVSGIKGKIPSYMGGRLPLSSELSNVLRQTIYDYREGDVSEPEIEKIIPLLELQRERSDLPGPDSLLIEYFHDKEGYHLLFYPFEGRSVHEGMAAIIATRLSAVTPISFSLAFNDYGFELLSDREIDPIAHIGQSLFSTQRLFDDIQKSLNITEMASRRFRDIAVISGLIFTGFPGKNKKDRHLQSSSKLLFDVFQQYEEENLLYLQAFEELRYFQMEESRLRQALDRLSGMQYRITFPEKATPFSFPLLVDRLRESMSSERLEDRIQRMLRDLDG